MIKMTPYMTRITMQDIARVSMALTDHPAAISREGNDARIKMLRECEAISSIFGSEAEAVASSMITAAILLNRDGIMSYSERLRNSLDLLCEACDIDPQQVIASVRPAKMALA